MSLRLASALCLLLLWPLGCRHHEATGGDPVAASPATSAPAPSATHAKRGSPAAAASARSAAPPQSAARPIAASASPSSLHAPHRGSLRELLWRYSDTPIGALSVAVAIPAWADEQHRLPVLVALHGQGEVYKGPDRGARGWLDDYALGRAVRRLHAPPLAPADFEGFVSDERLAEINGLLAAQPYRGMVVVCPYIPRRFSGYQPWEAFEPFAQFIVKDLLPRVYREAPAIGTAETTGIDGVSLGGRAALFIGLSEPRAFATVAALQAAFEPGEASAVARLAAEAVAQNPQLRIRLLTSDRDGYRSVNQAISRALGKRGLKHELDVVVGPHDYVFNRGPGSLEMLLFHDRALR